MRVLNYIESTIWAMLPSGYDRMHSIATRHSAEFDRALLEAAGKQSVSEKILLTEDGAKFNISSDVFVNPEAMMTRTGTRMGGTRYVSIRDAVAVIDLNGVIAMRMNIFQELCEGGTSTEMLAKDFQSCLDSPDVKAIVFLIHSPGGEAFGTNEFAQMVLAARGKKPIKAYVSGYGCSAAYFIAAAADEIILDAQAMVGSIGVVAEWQDATQLYKSLGIDRRVVTSSNAPKKRLDLNKPDDEKEFTAMLDAMENVFIKFVAKARSVSVEKVKTEFGQGGVLIGKDAVKAGMVDRTGSLEGVISELQRKPRKSNVSAQAETGLETNFKQEKNMSLKDRIMAIFAEEDETAPSLVTEKGETKPEGKSPELIKAEARVTELEAGQKKEKAESLNAAAKTFAAAEITAGRMLPAEKEEFVASYVQAAADDEVSPLAEGSRVARIEALQNKRKTNFLTRETVNSANNKIVFASQSDDKKMNDEVEAQVDAYVGEVGGEKN